MIETALPSPLIGGKGHHLRRLLANVISDLEITAPAYGGRHPAAVTLKATLDAAVTAVTALLPVTDGTMAFAPTAKSYSIAAGAAQAGPVLSRASGNDGVVNYTSGTPANATVNAATGQVTPLIAGTSVITATTPAYGGFAQSTKTYVATITA